MYSASTDPSYYQEKGFTLITQGRKLFADSEKEDGKLEGFKTFRKGIVMILTCYKRISKKELPSS